MMFRSSKPLWIAFGAVAILTAALSNTSCCSSRKVAEQSRTEVTAEVTATEHTESRSEEKHETTRTETMEGVTVTEIEIYDTTQPKDPDTGLPPVKARVKQRHDQNGTSRTTEQTAAADTTESDSTLEYDGGELDEVTVTATKTPGLWERMKQGAAWASAIMILAAAGWIIFKIKKR
nr:MAG TPA: hypothetical protein [Caudoviricetes sp.]